VSNDSVIEVIGRTHFVVAEATIPGSKQPYHYADNLELKEAEEYIARCFTASVQLASAVIREILSQLGRREYRVEVSGILMASGRTLPSLEKILASHALIHAAEGEFFRRVVRRACEEAGLIVRRLPERELEEQAKKTFGNKANQVKRQISSLGKRLGPPWTQDEKLAALAATLILAS
jgi:redox-regulated HSP33 family molecular chaperone